MEEILAEVEQTVVYLTAAGQEWTGVLVDESGLILTASRNLGNAPMATVRTFDGQTGTAWVIGRDDGASDAGFGLALLRIVDGRGPYPFMPVEAVGAPQVDQDLIVLQYSAGGTTVEKRTARVLGVRSDLTSGLRYIQVQAPSGARGQGALLVDDQGRFRGIRMAQDHMDRTDLARPGEVYGMDADGVINLALPRLETGVMIIREIVTDPDADPGPPPQLPAVFRGSATMNGAPLAAGSRVYARVVRAGQPDLWFTQEISRDGSYVLGAPVMREGYSGAMVEFWSDARQAAQTGTYQPGGNIVVNLTFE